MVLGGSHGFGTESAVRFVVEKDRMKELTGIVQAQDFMLLFRAFVRRNHGLRLGMLRLALLKNGKWHQVDV